MKDRFDAKNKKSLTLRFHTQTAGCSLTAQQYENNIVRVTMQALAGILGGTQSLHTNSMDEAYALPSEKAVRIALRTQQILGHENGVANTIDPLAGSYFIETLTNEIEEEVLKYIEKIDKMGGVLKAIERGFIQKEISDSAYKYQKEIEGKDRIIVGLNKFAIDEDSKIEILRVDSEVEKNQIHILKKLKEKRNNKNIKSILNNIEITAKSDENLIPIILEAVKSNTTLGEICDVLREVFGEYKAPTVL